MHNEKTPWDLKLHEEIEIDSWTTVKSVPGGWIYTTDNMASDAESTSLSSVFVPWTPKR